MLNLSPRSSYPVQRHLREILACSQLSHPNIVALVGVTSTLNHPLSLILDTADDLGLQEYLDDNPGADRLKLVRCLSSHIPLRVVDLSFRCQVRGIAHGLRHIHDSGAVHGRLGSVRSSLPPHFRNLQKLTFLQQNILVSPDGTPRIAGFGSCFTISRPELWSADIMGFHRGSAPELLQPPEPGKPGIRTSKASDMYAFGMLTWEVGTCSSSGSSIAIRC